MDELTYIIVAVPVVFIGVSVLIYFTAVTDVNIDVSPCDADVLPNGAKREVFDAAADPLMKLGFEDRGFWMLGMARMGVVIRWLYHRETCTQAAIMQITAPGTLVNSVEFQTTDVHKRDVETSNTTTPRVFSAHPDDFNRRMSWMKDPATLFHAHKVFLKESGFGPWAPITDPVRLPTDMRESMARNMDRQVELGTHRVKDATTYAPTIRGAILFTVRYLPPLRQWKQYREKREIMRVLKAAGVI